MKKKYMWYAIYGIAAYVALNYVLPSIAEARDRNRPKPTTQGG